MTKKKSTKRIKVMAIVMALSVIVCGVAVGVAASTKSDYSGYYIPTADGQDIGKGIPYEEDTDIKKFLDKDRQFNRYAYQEVMEYSHINAIALYELHAKWVYDKSDQIYKISFTPDPKNAATYSILQYNSKCHYLKKFLNRDNLTPEQIEKIKNFKYPEGF
ncbi:hypothetical protein [Candidatus Weimeria sp. HCP3S3_B5]|uniref:hypothetical protein n=1 Tax=Candidatus Weimeria sp. HCP3S3_B5 TaxID=3438871 RepID=UPI003F8B038E